MRIGTFPTCLKSKNGAFPTYFGVISAIFPTFSRCKDSIFSRKARCFLGNISVFLTVYAEKWDIFTSPTKGRRLCCKTQYTSVFVDDKDMNLYSKMKLSQAVLVLVFSSVLAVNGAQIWSSPEMLVYLHALKKQTRE